MKNHIFGLIGRSLKHSFSQKYFLEKFENEGFSSTCDYINFELEDLNEISTLRSMDALVGLNVTIPYKTEIIPFLDEMSVEAGVIGAVNTIRIVEGKWIGYNTDVKGFETSLGTRSFGSALVLGTGGASKAVAYVLGRKNIPFQYVSRTPVEGGMTYEEIDEHIMQQNDLIINTTPLGMYPRVEESPSIPYENISSNHFLYDLVYNPEKTLFLKLGAKNGARTMNGLKMLLGQAEASWQIWNENDK